MMVVVPFAQRKPMKKVLCLAADVPIGQGSGGPTWSATAFCKGSFLSQRSPASCRGGPETSRRGPSSPRLLLRRPPPHPIPPLHRLPPPHTPLRVIPPRRTLPLPIPPLPPMAPLPAMGQPPLGLAGPQHPASCRVRRDLPGCVNNQLLGLGCRRATCGGSCRTYRRARDPCSLRSPRLDIIVTVAT
jgi:hypothetical protein